MLFILALILSFSISLSAFEPSIETIFYRFYGEDKKSIEDVNFDKKLLFVSLGAHCQTAAQLNHYKLRNGAFPFDWILSDSIQHVITLLSNDFQFFFEEPHLFINPAAAWWLDNSIYQFEFRHEWPFSDTNFTEERIAEMVVSSTIKYARRIERFKKLRQFSGKVYFIRTASNLDPDYYWRDEKLYRSITKEQAQKLYNALLDFFPTLNFGLIIINYSSLIDPVANKWNENIFEFKAVSSNIIVLNAFEHVFAFIKALHSPIDKLNSCF